jgi:Transcriptional regulator, AbiEi antitoxin
MSSEIPPRLLELARAQAGVISRRQALAAGMSSSAIKSKVATGRWQRIHAGVYATFTGLISRNAHMWAAVLSAGPGAQLSHETAAELLRLSDRQSLLIHLKVPTTRHIRPLRGVVIHRSAYIEQGWRFARGVPPHTFAEQTIVDLLDAAVNFDDAVGWVTRAFQRNLTSEGKLGRALAARKKLRWRDRLKEAIPMAATGTHSTLEYRYDCDVERAHGLPPARKQVPFTKPDGAKGFRDRYYDEYGLVVELDGKQYHDDEQRDDDRRRDNAATATTGSTLRYGWADVTRTQCETAAQVYAALRKRGYTGKLKPCSATCTALAGPAA